MITVWLNTEVGYSYVFPSHTHTPLPPCTPPNTSTSPPLPYTIGLAWQKRAADILGDNGGLPVPFSVLEKLSNESTRLGCLLPRAKEVRVRLAAVRALLAEVDAALPPPPAGSSDDEDEEGEVCV